MTQLDELVPYSGTIPSLIDATDEYTYANEVENYLTWWDVTNTPQLENFRTKLNTLGAEIQTVYENTITVFNETSTLKDDVILMRDVVLNASNYNGIWSSDKVYDTGTSISYSDGNIYYSNVDNNSEEPIECESNEYWYFTGRKEFVYIKISDDYSAKEKDYIYADTSENVIAVTLPATPNENDIVGFLDVKGTFDINPLSIVRNGNLIMGLDEDRQVSTKEISFELIYINGDWRVK